MCLVGVTIVASHEGQGFTTLARQGGEATRGLRNQQTPTRHWRGTRLWFHGAAKAPSMHCTIRHAPRHDTTAGAIAGNAAAAAAAAAATVAVTPGACWCLRLTLPLSSWQLSVRREVLSIMHSSSHTATSPTARSRYLYLCVEGSIGGEGGWKVALEGMRWPPGTSGQQGCARLAGSGRAALCTSRVGYGTERQWGALRGVAAAGRCAREASPFPACTPSACHAWIHVSAHTSPPVLGHAEP